jgi:N6-adenosine-specific RNA methylase IME4
MTALPAKQRLRRLKELESIIDKGMDAWIRVGLALQEIRDGELYKEVAPTFEKWANDRFSIKRRHAYQLIDAVQALENVRGRAQIEPTSEWQLRPIAKLEPKEQVKAWKEAEKLAKKDKSELTEKHVRQAVREMGRQERIGKIIQISKANKPLKDIGPFPVLLADPPWQYDSGTTDPSRVIENQYPTMPLDEICALPVSDIAHQDAVLFLWATPPMLPEAMQVLDAWGFQYKTCAIWDKGSIGPGYFFRQQHELILVGERGSMPRPAASTRPSSVIKAARSGHSEKPAAIYTIIESFYPDLEKVELFARGKNVRPKWHRWGNEVP